MIYVNRALEWLCDPVNASIAITWVTAVLQAVASETGWRWARVTVRVLESLPGLNLKGLITAGRKSP